MEWMGFERLRGDVVYKIVMVVILMSMSLIL